MSTPGSGIGNEYIIRGYATEACAELSPGDKHCACVVSAIAKQDSGYATLGVGAKTNNPCNLRPIGENGGIPHTDYHSPGNGFFGKYANLRDGTKACVDLYVRKYKGLRTDTITWQWARTRNPAYYGAIRSCYN